MEEDLRRQEYSDDIGGKEERNEYKWNCCPKLPWKPNEGREEKRVGPEGGSFTSVAGNVCSASILRLLADSIACGDTQQWLSPAQGGKTK
jgi:hypothetical protein